MAYEEEQTKRSRVVVETPNARREVSRTETEYSPRDGGTSTATIAVVVILAIGVVVLLLLLVMNRQSNDNANLAAQQAAQPAQQQPVIVQQPAAQPQQAPIIVQQPAAAPAQAPIIVNPPAGGAAPNPNVPDDASIQAEVDKRIQRDSSLSALNLTVSVLNGKALLVGTVNSDELKRHAEKVVIAVKGVKNVDNQIIVSAG